MAVTYGITSERGTIHVDGCPEGNKLKWLSGGYATIEEARRIAKQDFENWPIKVARCAKSPR